MEWSIFSKRSPEHSRKEDATVKKDYSEEVIPDTNQLRYHRQRRTTLPTV